MKTRDFDTLPRQPVRQTARRKASEGPSLAVALLGGVCVLGLFAVLALLYHVQ
ncbi:MAG TPA: hypothetical protein PK231_01385 [Acidocella sp.]|jgi:hypothetical protein|nr:hypothetical protein [Acidocella sp.]HQT38045.1 hypothetical protein [Acidocella sp.]